VAAVVVILAALAAIMAASTSLGTWTELNCDCPELCGEGSASGSGSGGGGIVCKGINIPDTVTLTLAGIDTTFNDPPDNDFTILTYPGMIVNNLSLSYPPYQNTSYTLARFTTTIATCIDECRYCYRLGTTSLNDILNEAGVTAASGWGSDLPEYVYLGTEDYPDGPTDAYIAIHVCINFDPDATDYLNYCYRISGLYVRHTIAGVFVNGTAYPYTFDPLSGTAGGGLSVADWTAQHTEQPCAATGGPCYPGGPLTGTPPVLTSGSLPGPGSDQPGGASATMTWSTP